MTLEGFLDGSDSSLRSQLASGLRIPIPPPLPASVFLFDRIKEGVWDVKDMAELQIILGNSLLVLLSGGLTQQLSEGMSNADLAESGAHYNSIGTTLLFHDPDGLVDACTHRMAGEILEREFNSESSLPPRLVEDDVNEFLGKVGLLSEWLERVCVETLFRPLHDEKGFLELHFADLEFEGLPIQEWGDAISGQEAWFGAEIFPRQQAQFEQNAGVLADEVAIRLAELVEDLPERVGLYPGGLTTAEKIIVQLRDHIQSSADMLRRENSPTAFDFDAALQTALQDLDQAIESLPQPPHLLHRLPGVFRRPVLLLFDFLFLRREHARLVDLREGSVRILERKYAHLAEVAARRLLLGLCLRLQDELQATGRALERLQKALAAARKKLVPQTCLQTPSPLFRIPACDQAAMDWAFSQMQPPPDELRLALFEQHHLMEGWKSLTARTITARLMDFCRVICQPAGQFSLEDILSHRAEDDRDCLLALLLEGATPLLRPDFDRSGSGQSFQSQFFLCANPRASTLATALMSDWQILATGDPYHVLACRVRHLIPLTALDALIHRTKRAYGPSSFPQRRMGKG